MMAFMEKVLVVFVGCLLVQVFGIYDDYLSCGISNYVIEAENSNRLLVGNAAGKNFFPWVVGLEFENGVNCTGSIISSRHILTAAHCILEEPTDPLKYIRAGNTIIAKMEQLKFDSYIIHEKYGPNLINDLAIITLRENLNFSESISPICLPLHSKKFDYYTYAGFGVIYNGTLNENELEEGPFIQADHLKIPTKRLHFGKLKTAKSCDIEGEKLLNEDKSICTASFNGLTNADSGGPLMAFVNGRWFLEGIASGFFEHLILNSEPEIYSQSLFVKTSLYCDWIEENTKMEALCQRHNFMKQCGK